MPYDPANFRLTYAHNLSNRRSPDTEYETIKDWHLQAEYDYSPKIFSWEPFRNTNNSLDIFKIININFVPENIRFSSDINRYYQELQLREIISEQSSTEHLNNQKYLTFSSNFFWNRNFNFNWNITRNQI